jgi:anaerobic selenocysteine-containing dehydrogenase
MGAMMPALSANPMNPVLGACPHDCPDTCSLVTQVKDGVAISVKGNPNHPLTDGVLCTKVSRYTERTYHPERLLYPMKRVSPKGPNVKFERVTWAQALADIGERLKTLAAIDPQAILPYSYAGTMGQVQGEAMAGRFFNRLGASFLDRTICSSAGGNALAHTFGGKLGMRVEFFSEARLILIWGSNSIGSNLHFWRLAMEAKRHGAKLVCIDPRRSETADKCDVHLALKPGTDAALAFAIMQQLITRDAQEHWLDHGYLAAHTLGWPELRERALEWPPERAAEFCGLPVDQIIQLAEDYGRTRPAAIRLNYGVQRAHGGGNAVRAIACLPALIGAWRERSGGVLLSNSSRFSVNKQALQRPDLLGDRRPRTLNMSTIGNDLLRNTSEAFGPQVQALIVYNSNPVAVAPDSPKVVAGFAREDLFTVVLEHFQTDTADYADYVLPATTQLEHWDIHASYGHTDVLLNRPAIKPLGEAKTNTDIFRALAQEMGFNDPCFQEGDLSLCRQVFGESVDFELLLKQGFAHLEIPEAPFAHGGFMTPSGRCEMASSSLAALGEDPLPQVLPNYEPASAQWPLAMISPPARNFLNSSFVNLKSLRDIEIEPKIEIHPQDAEHRQIATGQTVRVFNERGSYVCQAEVSTRARPGLVVGLGIWWRKLGREGSNVNELTSQALTDMGRAPTFYDCAVEVAKIEA